MNGNYLNISISFQELFDKHVETISRVIYLLFPSESINFLVIYFFLNGKMMLIKTYEQYTNKHARFIAG